MHMHAAGAPQALFLFCSPFFLIFRFLVYFNIIYLNYFSNTTILIIIFLSSVYVIILSSWFFVSRIIYAILRKIELKGIDKNQDTKGLILLFLINNFSILITVSILLGTCNLVDFITDLWLYQNSLNTCYEVYFRYIMVFFICLILLNYFIK
jgi:CBS domain containing-hemolysin-like protein